MRKGQKIPKEKLEKHLFHLSIVRPPKGKTLCHPDLPHIANGMCKQCYGFNSHLSRKFPDFDLEKYKAMWEHQKGKCANPFCSYTAAWDATLHKRLQVDHSHLTGKIRGLLCPSCNKILGHANDNINRLLGLKKYLENGKVLGDYCIVLGVMDYSKGKIFVTSPQEGAEGSIKRDMALVLNQRIREGYELQGGVVFVSGDLYAQAIVKWVDMSTN
jgi:Recombination endonuclease VII